MWIIGGFDSKQKSNFYVKIVENRQISTIFDALKGKVGFGFILRSDGHQSYPGVAERLSLIHEVVNHSTGFITEDGIHTNNIENLWSCMKSEMTRQHGVKKKSIEIWVEYFMFRRKYIDETSPESFKNVFYMIIKTILNYLFIFI
ncbi:hypothetical protein DMUE_4995 [Dictyocoela muelleri]|nr:hypothetical protein DMUE_4995 [Dictyocoela muelleri]